MMNQCLRVEENFLVYLLDANYPLKLSFHLLYCDEEITDFLHKERWYFDPVTRMIVEPSVTIDTSVPDEHTMEQFQYIKGFISGKSYLPHILTFRTEELKNMYVNRLISTLTHLSWQVANLGRPYGSTEIIERKVNVQVF